jgi:hypothetical protein
VADPALEQADAAGCLPERGSAPRTLRECDGGILELTRHTTTFSRTLATRLGDELERALR